MLDVEHECFFSIVTICYNAKSEIERTLVSVRNQTCVDYEYIIIDGLSTDGTQDLIQKSLKQWDNKSKITFISEQDSGIYNAMNKGARLSKGDWICFMNAGDEFATNTVLENVKSAIESNINYDVVFGDTILKDFEHQMYTYRRAGNYKKLTSQMPFFHQSTFTKSETLKNIPFDEKYKICADHNFFVKVLNRGGGFLKVPFPIAIFTNDGISCTGYDSTIERVQMLMDNGSMPKEIGNKRVNKLVVLRAVRKVIPYKVRMFRKRILKQGFFCAENGWYKNVDECLKDNESQN